MVARTPKQRQNRAPPAPTPPRLPLPRIEASERPLAGGGGLAVLLGGVDVGHSEAAGLAGLGIGQLPVSDRPAIAGAQLGRKLLWLSSPFGGDWRGAMVTNSLVTG
jgi:hypothetical protein